MNRNINQKFKGSFNEEPFCRHGRTSSGGGSGNRKKAKRHIEKRIRKYFKKKIEENIF